ncbi:pancreatic secretory granule membrane major glycoprotein GP2-like [Rana temporaria]|uniref:pancreatic secretory granule membrane major glycoprotein GP2-like n=1 Tax=Rana temporaria TaxID=8407 RepID=UPI001AAD4B71|nr:pancreatic secretory granule membrane major glycoprotein GP2-like [Rana temporaria]
MLGHLFLTTQSRHKRMLFLGFVTLLAALGIAGSTPSCYTVVNGSPPLCSSCSGTCVQISGCTCSNTSSCVPDAGCTLNSSSCCPANLSWNPNLNCCTADPYCSPTCLADEVCLYVNQTAVCAANATYYTSQGLNVYNVSYSVKCESSNMTISVGKNLLEVLGYKPSASTLLQSNCSGAVESILNGQRVYSLTVQNGVGICGNNMVKNTTTVSYTNAINVLPNTDNGLLTVSNLNIAFTCSYNISMWTSLFTVFKPVVSTQNLNSGGSSSSALTSMAAYTNPSYSVPVQESQQENMPIGSTLYFGMSTQFPDPIFVLRIEQCFATPTPDGSGAIKVQLIQGGCTTGQVGVQLIGNGNSSEVRFSISSFSFKNYDSVYIFCNARLCNKGSGTCASCGSSRDVSEDIQQFSLGPFSFVDTEDSSAVSHKGLSLTILMASLLTTWILLMSEF